MKNLLIIEFNSFHEEVILSQIEFLKNSNYNVHLYINDRILQKYIKLDLEFIKYIKGNNKYTKAIFIYSVLKYIKSNNIDIVIFNTLEDKYIRILNKFIPSNVKKIGIIHNIDRFEDAKLNILNFLVLSENVFNNLDNECFGKFSFNYFYPLIYEEMQNKERASDKFNIIIPGLVDFQRRDYLGLLELLKKTNISHLQFTILGNISQHDGPEVLEKIKEYNLESLFKVHHSLVPYDEYFSTLDSADLIMPLIHPSIDNYKKYHTTKITAAFSMAFSFKVPLLIYETLHRLDEFNKFSISYSLDDLVLTLNSLEEEKITKVKTNINNEKKFLFKTQKSNYLSFL